ncbi:MAG TPA: hypothetical protein VF581_11300 [Flavobacterium sp.]|jgi:hypothetical protein
MKGKYFKIAAMFLVLLTMQISCKEPNGEAQDVGTGTGNGEGYSDPGTGGTEDHPGQNIGSDNDSTTVDGPKGNPSNH